MVIGYEPLPTGSGFMKRQSRRAAGALAAAVTVLMAVSVLMPTQASAAGRISACFSYGGVRYQGLSTSVEYLTTSNRWHYLDASGGRTLSDGCVAYNITGRYRGWRLRIRATAAVPQWRGLFNGYSPYSSPGGRRSWNLGNGNLALYALPPQVPTAPTYAPSFGNSYTSGWLDQMTGGNNVNCSSSSAMLVACYMDAHGMHGNVVVPPRDYDGDGIPDWNDPYPWG